MMSDRRQFERIDHVPGPPVDATPSRSTLMIIVVSAGAALVGGVLATVVWLGLMAVVFRGDGETDGVSVLALIVLGIVTVTVVALVLYLRAGIKMIRQHRAKGRRTRPGLILLSVPVLAVLAVVLLNR